MTVVGAEPLGLAKEQAVSDRLAATRMATIRRAWLRPRTVLALRDAGVGSPGLVVRITPDARTRLWSGPDTASKSSRRCLVAGATESIIGFPRACPTD
ncbi:hypothetical protein PSD17_20010 [Pseudonocardia sp. D17]|nr:hypothetical protein PSD17_20010 [Pseudonocardia sp. D17]